MQYVKPKDMFNLIEVAQDILGTIENRAPNAEEFIIIRDALIEANKMRIALQRISSIDTRKQSISNALCQAVSIADNAMKLIEY